MLLERFQDTSIRVAKEPLRHMTVKLTYDAGSLIKTAGFHTPVQQAAISKSMLCKPNSCLLPGHGPRVSL